MDGIKFNGLGLPVNVAKLDKNNKTALPTEVRDENVKVTNHLGRLVGLLGPAESIPDETQRVMEMKQKIHSGNYSVDVPALADNLIKNGII